MSSSLVLSNSPSEATLSDELLVAKLDLFRDQERLSSTYLGNKNIIDNVVWINVGRGHRLVAKELVDSWNGEEDDDAEKDTSLKFSKLPSVELSVIARISREDCWLAPDGLWKGMTKVTPTFADLKLSCTAESPGYPDFDTEFDRALDNIQLIMAARETPSIQLKKGLLLNSESTGATKIKFRHALFIRKEDEDAVSSTSSDLPSQFQIENWPVESEQAHESLDKMTKTHTVIPLPAYDTNGNLIFPIDYRTKIPGGLAVINFTLSHWFFAIPKPMPRPSYSPRKKRPSLTNPRANVSPISKKKKTDDSADT